MTGPEKLIIRLALYLRSAARPLYLRLFVIRKARYRQKASKSASACESRSYQLCFTCDLLVDNSRLLTGTSWIFARPFEHHVYYTARDQQNSAKDCHLCNFLLRSVGPVSQDGLGSGPATPKVRHPLPLLTPPKGYRSSSGKMKSAVGRYCAFGSVLTISLTLHQLLSKELIFKVLSLTSTMHD
jgi:hypothetical protein